MTTNFREAWASFPEEQLNNSNDNLVNFCTNMGPLLSCTWPNKDDRYMGMNYAWQDNFRLWGDLSLWTTRMVDTF